MQDLEENFIDVDFFYSLYGHARYVVQKEFKEVQ